MSELPQIVITFRTMVQLRKERLARLKPQVRILTPPAQLPSTYPSPLAKHVARPPLVNERESETPNSRHLPHKMTFITALANRRDEVATLGSDEDVFCKPVRPFRLAQPRPQALRASRLRLEQDQKERERMDFLLRAEARIDEARREHQYRTKEAVLLQWRDRVHIPELDSTRPGSFGTRFYAKLQKRHQRAVSPLPEPVKELYGSETGNYGDDEDSESVVSAATGNSESVVSAATEVSESVVSVATSAPSSETGSTSHGMITVSTTLLETWTLVKQTTKAVAKAAVKSGLTAAMAIARRALMLPVPAAPVRSPVESTCGSATPLSATQDETSSIGRRVKAILGYFSSRPKPASKPAPAPIAPVVKSRDETAELSSLFDFKFSWQGDDDASIISGKSVSSLYK